MTVNIEALEHEVNGLHLRIKALEDQNDVLRRDIDLLKQRVENLENDGFSS